MTKLKLIILNIFVLLIVGLAIGVSGSPFLLFIDTPSFILVPIFPYIISTFTYSFKTQHLMSKEVFKKPGEGDKKVLNQAKSYIKLLQQLSIAAAVLGFFMGFIGMMGNLESISSVGRNTGVALISIFYGIYFNFALVIPIKGIIQKNIDS